MFMHTLITKTEVDLDKLFSTLQNDPEIVDFMIRKIGSAEYGFVLEAVDDRITKIKEYTPMPIE